MPFVQIRHVQHILQSVQPVASWVEKVGASSCKFPTEKIMGAQIFNLALKFPQ